MKLTILHLKVLPFSELNELLDKLKFSKHSPQKITLNIEKMLFFIILCL